MKINIEKLRIINKPEAPHFKALVDIKLEDSLILEDIKLLEMSSQHKLVKDSPAAQAFLNTAKRMMGEEVPIMEFSHKKEKRSLFFWKNKKSKEKR